MHKKCENVYNRTITDSTLYDLIFENSYCTSSVLDEPLCRVSRSRTFPRRSAQACEWNSNKIYAYGLPVHYFFIRLRIRHDLLKALRLSYRLSDSRITTETGLSYGMCTITELRAPVVSRPPQHLFVSAFFEHCFRITEHGNRTTEQLRCNVQHKDIHF